MSDNPGEIGLGLGAVDPLTGVSPEQGADWLRGAAKAYLDWRAGNQASVENALMAGAGKSPNELMAGAGHVDLSNPLLMAFAGPGVIKGFHGTPHTFEPVEGNPFGEFRNEAIGTGEGAQAYGWGHYVAGNPKTAETYQKELSPAATLMLGEKPWVENFRNDPVDPAEFNAYLIAREADRNLGPNGEVPDLDHALTITRNRFAQDPEMLKDVEDFLHRNIDSLRYLQDEGNLLEVHILPHEHELLDWDKPFSQQTPDIQAKLNDVLYDSGVDKQINLSTHSHGASGANLYNYLSSKFLGSDRNQAASAALHSAGIPGIKYLDAGSRAAGEGTYNYVIFDPSNLRIVARNGQRLEPVNHDPFAAQAGKLEDMRLTREGLIPDEFGNPNFFSNLLKKGSP